MNNIWNDPRDRDQDELEEGYHPELDTSGAPPLDDTPEPPQRQVRQRRQVSQPERFEEEGTLIDIIEGAADDDDEDAENEAALSDARLRLEMGRLYEMVMKSDLFNNLDADPQAIKNVQRQIKRFAKEQMEVMLGMRAVKEETTQIVSPFNELEIEVLKRLAFTATKGASAAGSAPKATLKASPGPQPPPKATALSPIGPQKTTPVKPQGSRPVAPLKRQAPPPQAVPQRRTNESKPLEKPLHEMTDEELIARNHETAQRQKRAVPKDALPPMSPEAMNALYATRVQQQDKNVSAVAEAVLFLNKE